MFQKDLLIQQIKRKSRKFETVIETETEFETIPVREKLPGSWNSQGVEPIEERDSSR